MRLIFKVGFVFGMAFLMYRLNFCIIFMTQGLYFDEN